MAPCIWCWFLFNSCPPPLVCVYNSAPPASCDVALCSARPPPEARASPRPAVAQSRVRSRDGVSDGDWRSEEGLGVCGSVVEKWPVPTPNTWPDLVFIRLQNFLHLASPKSKVNSIINWQINQQIFSKNKTTLFDGET